MTLADVLLARANGLNVVRLLLASLVIALHAWSVGQFDSSSSFYGAAPLGQWAVPGFFCLSGFLVAGSRMRLSLGRFLWHRSLRIFPGYVACLLMIAFVLAPLSTLAGGTWHLAEALDYVRSNVLLIQLQLTIPGTVDGRFWDFSLWTLIHEFLAYLLAGLLLIGATHRTARGMCIVLVGMLTAASAWAFGPGDVSADVVLTVLPLASCFAAGMLLYFTADRVPCRATWAVACLVLIGVAQALGIEDVVGALPLAYLVLSAGAAIPARFSPRDDLSYGVYIYAFPVQILLEWFRPDLGLVTHAVAALLLTLPLAFLSWRVVERPALRLKSLGRKPDVSSTRITTPRTPARSGAAPRDTPA